MNRAKKQIETQIKEYEYLIRVCCELNEKAKILTNRFASYFSDANYDEFCIELTGGDNVEHGIHMTLLRYNEERNFAFKINGNITRNTDEDKYEYEIDFEHRHPGRRLPNPKFDNIEDFMNTFETFVEEDRKKLLDNEKKKLNKILNRLPG